MNQHLSHKEFKSTGKKEEGEQEEEICLEQEGKREERRRENQIRVEKERERDSEKKYIRDREEQRGRRSIEKKMLSDFPTFLHYRFPIFIHEVYGLSVDVKGNA